MAAEQTPVAMPEAVEPEQAPMAAADQPPEETEKRQTCHWQRRGCEPAAQTNHEEEDNNVGRKRAAQADEETEEGHRLGTGVP